MTADEYFATLPGALADECESLLTLAARYVDDEKVRDFAIREAKTRRDYDYYEMADWYDEIITALEGMPG